MLKRSKGSTWDDLVATLAPLFYLTKHPASLEEIDVISFIDILFYKFRVVVYIYNR